MPQENRAKRVGTQIRITTQDIDELKGMRPFQDKRFGTISGHKYTDGKLTGYVILANGKEYTLARSQFATSALTKSFRYAPKKANVIPGQVGKTVDDFLNNPASGVVRTRP